MTTIKAIRIPVEGAPSVVELDNTGGSTLNALQGQVGGYIECVNLDQHTDLWLNEDGKNIGLPLNERATQLTRGILSMFDLVVGDCVIAGIDYDSGETVDVPQEWIDKVVQA